MENKKSLQERVEELKSQNELKLQSEIKCLEIQEDILELTGIKFMIVDYGKECKDFGLIAENGSYSGDLFERNSIKDIVKKIENHLDLKPKNFVYGFAGKESIETLTNIEISIDNNVSEYTWDHPTTAKIIFHYENYRIDFKDHLYKMFKNEDLNFQTGIHPEDNNRKNPRQKRIAKIRDFYTIRYVNANFRTSCMHEADKKCFFELVYLKNE